MSRHRYTRLQARLRRFVKLCRGADETARIDEAARRLNISVCFIQQLLRGEPVPEDKLDQIEQSIGFSKTILSVKTSRRCAMPDCPFCDKPHRYKPTKCLMQAFDRHQDICTAARHNSVCC